MIGLIDCNNFYASCERAFNPKLDGKPLGILSNNDGCVIARSNELKPFVPMGMPAFKIPPDIRKKIILFSSNYELYGDMSQRVFDIVQQHIPEIEFYSIDEAFITLNDNTNFINDCIQLKAKIRQCTGIPVSIGLSSTKTLAKIANHIAKKNPQFRGIYYLNHNGSELESILNSFSVTDIWGIGKRLALRLENMSIKNAWQLRNADPKHIRNHFSVVVERTILELRGIACIDLGDLETPKKNIMTSRSFGQLSNDLNDIHEAIRTHASRGAEKLRAQHSLAQAILVFMRTNRFHDKHLRYFPSIVIPLPYPTDDTRVIIQAAQKGVHSIYKKQFCYQKAGVMLLDLVDKDMRQLDFFRSLQTTPTFFKNDILMKTLDKINHKLGRGTIRFGGIRPEAPWNLKRELLSKRYTTRWDELPLIKV
ncbi:Protein UmuC [Commensalibacter sp. Nvir]|uniref:Y-family DNA polymerase n=1 Tax=Commensalibacter sp. Nvir TaxID=3069817 RepID=UPI002D4D5D8E|nr:Protein UmuC [Commensalibacter sp. Nvir]